MRDSRKKPVIICDTVLNKTHRFNSEIAAMDFLHITRSATIADYINSGKMYKYRYTFDWGFEND